MSNYLLIGGGQSNWPGINSDNPPPGLPGANILYQTDQASGVYQYLSIAFDPLQVTPSPTPHFGSVLQTTLNLLAAGHNVLASEAAQNGSAIEEWVPSGVLGDQCFGGWLITNSVMLTPRTVNSAFLNVFIWCQGEAEAQDGTPVRANQWATQFAELLQYVEGYWRQQFDRVIIIQTSTPQTGPQLSIVQAQQAAAVAACGPRGRLVITNDLAIPANLSPDLIHWLGSTQNIIGNRVSAAILAP